MAARFMDKGAQGGQIACTRELANKVVAAWSAAAAAPAAADGSSGSSAVRLDVVRHSIAEDDVSCVSDETANTAAADVLARSSARTMHVELAHQRSEPAVGHVSSSAGTGSANGSLLSRALRRSDSSSGHGASSSSSNRPKPWWAGWVSALPAPDSSAAVQGGHAATPAGAVQPGSTCIDSNPSQANCATSAAGATGVANTAPNHMCSSSDNGGVQLCSDSSQAADVAASYSGNGGKLSAAAGAGVVGGGDGGGARSFGRGRTGAGSWPGSSAAGAGAASASAVGSKQQAASFLRLGRGRSSSGAAAMGGRAVSVQQQQPPAVAPSPFVMQGVVKVPFSVEVHRLGLFSFKGARHGYCTIKKFFKSFPTPCLYDAACCPEGTNGSTAALIHTVASSWCRIHQQGAQAVAAAVGMVVVSSILASVAAAATLAAEHPLCTSRMEHCVHRYPRCAGCVHRLSLCPYCVFADSVLQAAHPSRRWSR